MVTDRSAALENALSMAFNWIPFEKFNRECLFILIDGKPRVDSIRCWIRNDVSHLIKSVTRWECFKSAGGKNRKNFYCRLIGYLTTLEDIDHFIKVVKDIFLVASSKLDTDSVQLTRKTLTGYINTFEKKQPDTISVITTNKAVSKATGDGVAEINPDEDLENDFGLDEDQAVFDLDSDKEDLEELEDTQAKKKRKRKLRMDLMSVFIRDLQPQPDKDTKEKKAGGSKAKQSEPEFLYSQNSFCCDGFVKSFGLLLRSFPAWTNLMKSYFKESEDVPTSARSENDFSQIKSSLREICSRSMRVDKFLSLHCDIIDAKMREAFALYNKMKDSAPTIEKKKNPEKEDFEYLQFYENWKNRGADPGEIDASQNEVYINDSSTHISIPQFQSLQFPNYVDASEGKF